jgi:imidazolonepropionase
MAQPIDLLIHSAAQLVTCAGSREPKRGAALRDVGMIPHGAVAVHQGQIVAVGPNDVLRHSYVAEREIDATQRIVCPGFVDPHTHVVFAGDRIGEFEQRIAGATYMEIMAAGGGIRSTMRATRAASVEQLVAESRRRLDQMLAQGTTTAEAKTGYGLERRSCGSWRRRRSSTGATRSTWCRPSCRPTPCRRSTMAAPTPTSSW